MIKREVEKRIISLIKKYAVVALVGPRQSGKSTLARHILKGKPYFSLEDLDEREFALKDPRGFLVRLQKKGGIIDEVQKCPSILSYLQTGIDSKSYGGPIIITGSTQLTLLSSVTQTLAGRVAIVELLPFSYKELASTSVRPGTLEEMLFSGFYPPIYDKHIDPVDWYPDYIRTYIERDVRDVLKVQDLATFQRFLRMCAARVGQILNLSSLASDCGISHTTAMAWINILEATYILFRVQPHYENFSKRLIKSPKLFFYDTGVLCSLLGIERKADLSAHMLRGSIMENWVAIEIIKRYFNTHSQARLFFWRDNKGIEIDFIIEKFQKLIPIEVKSGLTIGSDFFKNLKIYSELAHKSVGDKFLIYAGDQNRYQDGVNVINWKEIEKIIKSIS